MLIDDWAKDTTVRRGSSIVRARQIPCDHLDRTWQLTSGFWRKRSDRNVARDELRDDLAADGPFAPITRLGPMVTSSLPPD